MEIVIKSEICIKEEPLQQVEENYVKKNTYKCKCAMTIHVLYNISAYKVLQPKLKIDI